MAVVRTMGRKWGEYCNLSLEPFDFFLMLHLLRPIRSQRVKEPWGWCVEDRYPGTQKPGEAEVGLREGRCDSHHPHSQHELHEEGHSVFQS